MRDTPAFAEGMQPEKVDEVLLHFQMFYCMVCAEAGIAPHHFEETAWRKAIAEINVD